MLTRVGVPVEYEAEPSAPDPEPATLICFSHLRWNFVFQRPQHLMSRFAREMNVIYWEEPVDIGPSETAYLQVREAADCAAMSAIVVPHLPAGHARRCARSRAEAPARRPCRVAARAADRLVLHADDAALLARISTPTSPSTTRWTSLASSSSRPTQLLELEQELIDKRRHRLHRRLEPVRGEEGPAPTSIASRRRSIARISPRRARVSSTPPTRKTCPGRASASTA